MSASCFDGVIIFSSEAAAGGFKQITNTKQNPRLLSRQRYGRNGELKGVMYRIVNKPFRIQGIPFAFKALGEWSF